MGQSQRTNDARSGLLHLLLLLLLHQTLLELAQFLLLVKQHFLHILQVLLSVLYFD